MNKNRKWNLYNRVRQNVEYRPYTTHIPFFNISVAQSLWILWEHGRIWQPLKASLKEKKKRDQNKFNFFIYLGCCLFTLLLLWHFLQSTLLFFSAILSSFIVRKSQMSGSLEGIMKGKTRTFETIKIRVFTALPYVTLFPRY